MRWQLKMRKQAFLLGAQKGKKQRASTEEKWETQKEAAKARSSQAGCTAERPGTRTETLGNRCSCLKYPR